MRLHDLITQLEAVQIKQRGALLDVVLVTFDEHGEEQQHEIHRVHYAPKLQTVFVEA